eukprot:PITA_13108
MLALLLMTLLCFVYRASSVLNYTHPEDGFYGHHLNDHSASVSIERNMLQEGHQVPLWMDMQALLSFKRHITDPSGSGQLRTQKKYAPGGIPPEIGQLKKLRVLDLSYNSLSGRIPPTLSNCTKLSTLFLSSNYFTGTIPTVFGRLVKLEQLDLSYNSLTGSIPPTLSNCTKLWTLFLSSNKFTGTLPTAFGRLIELQHINLRNNSLSGHLPLTLGNCTRLQSLIMNDNWLAGIISHSIFGSSLKIFEVSQNSFSGDLDITFPVSMVIFSVYSNNFTGCFPSSLVHCSKLKVIDLRKNRFTWEIPLYIPSYKF